MQIKCPLCSTAIDITEAHLGQKARCLGCQSKFIIPTTIGEDFQILERGPDYPEEPAAAKSATAASEPPKRTRAAAPATASSGRTLAAPSGNNAAARSIAAKSFAKKKNGSAGFIITCLLIAGGVGFGWMKMTEKDKIAEAEKAAAANAKAEAEAAAKKNKKPEPKTVAQAPVQPAEPTPTVVVNEPEEPEEPAMQDDAPDGATPFKNALLGDPAIILTDEKKTRALAFMKSSKPEKRKGAYTAFRKLGDPGKQAYTSLLKEAREFHLEALGNKAFDLSIGQNALSNFEEAHDEWKNAADAALAMVQTNWKSTEPKDYKAKHAEMDSAVEAVKSLYDKLPKAMVSTGGRDLQALQAGADVLAELGSELAWAEGDDAEKKPLRDFLKEAGGADDFVEILDLLTSTRTATIEADAVAKHNAEINWGTSTYMAFATMLNERRVSLGLPALRLDQKLSGACEGHSGDMLFLAYFSHTGADGSSFGTRAKRANFAGSASGECIFKGSAAAGAAHNAWWYSDGHRLIMYASGPNTLGLGTASSIWTLNTGKKRW